MTSCFARLAFFTLTLLTASGCTPQAASKTGTLASGNLVSIGKEHLVMQSDDHVMFVSVDEKHKRTLNSALKKGDRITLLGKQDVEEISPGRTRKSAEVYEIVKEDGTRIALNR